MKSITKSFINAKRSTGRTKSANENTKLIPLDVNDQSYGGSRQRIHSESSSRSSSRPTSPQGVRKFPSVASDSSYNNPVFDAPPTIQIRPGQHPPPPLPTKVDASLDINFDNVPFQFYTVKSDDWKTAKVQAALLILLCLLLPSLFVIILMIGNKIRMHHKPKMTAAQRRSAVLALVGLFVVTLTKDMIVVMVALHVFYKSPVSVYAVTYSPIVYAWSLIFFAFPLCVFYFSKAKYVFGFDCDRKALLQTLKQLITGKAKQDEFKKVDDQEKFFVESYPHLSSIKGSTDEFTFLLNQASKGLRISCIGFALFACIVHCLIPLFLQIMECSLCQNTAVFIYLPTNSSNTTNNHTLSSDTSLVFIYKTILGLSAINSFFVSIFASAFFTYLTLWKISMLKEWQRFNETERSSKTLVNGGPQGIAMWWKVRQTLKLFSTSNLSMTVLIGKFACIVATALISSLSIALMYKTFDLESKFHSHAAIPLLFDNILLYLSVLIIALLNFLIYHEKNISSHQIEIKQLNVSYELGRLMNLDQEHVESEPAVRIKLRVMRGCLMLLQELTTTMDKLEKSATSQLNLICFVIATFLILPSTFSTVRFLIYKGNEMD